MVVLQDDRELTNLIRRKFAIKCTTGYSINALVDFPATDPIEIIKRLLVGSEGTLGFVSRVTYNTVPEWPHKASTFMVFPDVHSACAGASVLRDETTVDAVELFDRCGISLQFWFSRKYPKTCRGQDPTVWYCVHMLSRK